MIGSLLELSWIASILASAAAIGFAINGPSSRDRIADLLMGIPVGLAALAAVYGWLGLFGFAFPSVLTTVAVLGSLGCWWFSRRRDHVGPASIALSGEDRALAIALILAAAIAAIRYWSTSTLNGDDSSAYVPLGRLFAREGGFTPQPFSERRIFTLAAELPFRSVATAWFGMPGARGVDVGIGLLGVLLYFLGVGLRTRDAGNEHAGKITTIALMFLCAPMVRPQMVLTNLAPQYLQALALAPLVVASMMVHSSSSPRSRIRGAVAAGLCSALALGFRASLGPLLAVLVVVWAIRARRGLSWRDGVSQAIAAASGAVVVLVPFMVAAYASGHTALFPFLGRGFHASAVGLGTLAGEASPLTVRIRSAIEAIPRNPMFWVLAAMAIARPPGRAFNRASLIRVVTLIAAALVWCWALERTGGVLVGDPRIRTFGGGDATGTGRLASILVYALGAGAFLVACTATRPAWMTIGGTAAWLGLVSFTTAGTGAFRYTFPATVLLAATMVFSVRPSGRFVQGAVRSASIAFALLLIWRGGRDPGGPLAPGTEWPFVRSIVRDSVPTLGKGKLLVMYDRADLLVNEFGSAILLDDQPGLAGPALALRALRGEQPLGCLARWDVRAVLFVDREDAADPADNQHESWIDSLAASARRTVHTLRARAEQSPRVWRSGAAVILPIEDRSACQG